MTTDLSYLASLAVYVFGAVTLSVLTALYWSGRRKRSGVLPFFALVCAVAFVNNLLSHAAVVEGAALVLIRNVVAGLLPALMLHLVVEFVSPGLPWRVLTGPFYAISVGSTLARGLNESGILATPATGLLYFAPAGMLLAASVAGIVLLSLRRPALRPIDRAHRRSLLWVLIPLLVCAIANFDEPGPLMRQAPDYLVLSFFCVTLYFRERLAFIDLLVKRGVYFAIGLAVFAGCLTFGTPSIYVTGALALVLWLAAPAVYARIDRLIDSAWLRRPCSPADAERQFIREIQAAGTEAELRELAARSLGTIFRARAEVRFEPVAEQEPDDEGLHVGSLVRIAPREDGIPFLSDDRRLVESLAGALGVVLENVRFRAERRRQDDREQQLRWLASRAELKALRAQINPHFLFNALSAITGLVQDHPERAAETIEELAQVFRYALRKSESEWAALAEEVEFVTAYLHVEQARFGKRLKTGIDVDPAVSRIPIPAMTIQPLIENAVKHGVSNQEEGGVVGLRATLQGDVVRIEVFDSGPGFPPDFDLEHDGDGHGLRNVMERLRGYYGERARLSWDSGPDGTRVVLVLPQSALYAAAARGASDSRSDRR